MMERNISSLGETLNKFIGDHKRVDRRLSDIQKILSFATSLILEIVHKSFKCQKESESSFDHKKVGSTATDAIFFIAKATQSQFFCRKERSFKPCPE